MNFTVYNTFNENILEFLRSQDIFIPNPKIVTQNELLTPEFNYYFLDTSNSELECVLPEGFIRQLITVSLLYKRGKQAIVNTPTGSFFLDSYTFCRQLIYTEKGWLQYGEFSNNSFFVTTQEGDKLIGSNAIGFSGQGGSVALSADGNTLAIGGYGDNSDIGAVWVFIRENGVWSQQGNKLVGTGYVGQPQQYYVSLSADGNTLAVGGPNDNTEIGAVWIFTRQNGVWSQQGNKLVGTGYVGQPEQGYVLSLSADGNTVAFSGIYDNTNVGAVWIFTRQNGVWSQQGNKLVGTGYVAPSYQGSSLSISADGNILAIGATQDNGQIGGVWVFNRVNGVWSQQGSKLVGTGASGVAIQGSAVALSADGNTLAVGGSSDNGFNGATWIFVYGNSGWVQQGEKLVGTGAVGPATQGYALDISSDGNVLAVGGPEDNNLVGAVWLFKRSGVRWSQQGVKLVGSSSTPPSAKQGSSVALSSNGNTLAVGGPENDNLVGSTWIYV